MANRYMVRNYMSLEKAPVALYVRVAIGATGAPTLNALQSQGVLSISRTGVGAYTINFGSAVGVDTYQRLMAFSYCSVAASGQATAACNIVADNSAVLATPGINIQFVDFAGAAVDPASGENLRIEIVLSNSTAN